MIEEFIKYILIGFFSAYLLIYGLRPSIPYPHYILEPYEHNWMFIVIFIINYYLFIWDIKLGALMLLCVIALIFDMFLFTKKNFNTNPIPVQNNLNINKVHFIV